MYGHREHRRTVSVFDRSDVYDDHREHRRNRRIATARCTLSYDGHREHRNRRIAISRCTFSDEATYGLRVAAKVGQIN